MYPGEKRQANQGLYVRSTVTMHACVYEHVVCCMLEGGVWRLDETNSGQASAGCCLLRLAMYLSFETPSFTQPHGVCRMLVSV